MIYFTSFLSNVISSIFVSISTNQTSISLVSVFGKFFEIKPSSVDHKNTN